MTKIEGFSHSIPLARPFATFPRFAANHPIPSPVPFSRAANSVFEPSLKKWEHRPHPDTDMQPLTRLVAVSSSSGPAGRRVCEEMCMSLQNNGLKP